MPKNSRDDRDFPYQAAISGGLNRAEYRACEKWGKAFYNAS